MTTSAPLQLRQSARFAGLHYVQDSQPGIKRQRWGRGFTYFDADGQRITDETERDRLKAIKIPPGWTDVWICANPKGHLLATGRDARGRKQYLYHPDWRRLRSQAKYNRMLAFGKKLPQLRKAVRDDINQPGFCRTKIIAIVVQLLEKTLIRIGNEAYAQENQSFGLTTLRDRHVSVHDQHIRFQFPGKSGVDHDIRITHAQLAKTIKRCQELPGHELFQYRDDEGVLQSVDSGDVNDYLQEIMGDRFSAKDFRTWFGTIWALESLIQQEQETPKQKLSGTTEAQQELREERIRIAIQQTAEHLGNRPATCKKYYIHPYIFEAYLQGELLPKIVRPCHSKIELQTLEQGLLMVLEPSQTLAKCA